MTKKRNESVSTKSRADLVVGVPKIEKFIRVNSITSRVSNDSKIVLATAYQVLLERVLINAINHVKAKSNIIQASDVRFALHEIDPDVNSLFSSMYVVGGGEKHVDMDQVLSAIKTKSKSKRRSKSKKNNADADADGDAQNVDVDAVKDE